jgi:hypothetical protein
MKSFIFKRFSLLSMAGLMAVTMFGISAIPKYAEANSLPFYWANAQGGTSADEAMQVAVAGTGEVYVVGEFYGSGDFDPGAGTTTLTSAGQSDVYIVKYNSSGTLAWAKSIGGTNFDDVTGVVLSGDGNLVVSGYFLGTSDFDPGAGTANLSAGASYTPYLLKLDSSGDYSWARSFTSSGMAFGSNATTDSSENIYFAGGYEGTMDADPGAGTSNVTSAGQRDIFVIKLDSAGLLTWVKSIGGTGFDHSIAIADDNSNIYLTGVFEGTVDFDPGAGTNNLVSNGGRDIYMLKLTTAGVFSLAKSAGGSGTDTPQDIFVKDTNIYLTGSFGDTVDFDPGAGTSNATSAGSTDVFAWKLNSSAELSWIKTFGGSSADIGYGISVNDLGDVVVVGSYFGTIDLDPGAGEESYTADGGVTDGFVVLMQSDGSHAWSMDIGSSGVDAVFDVTVDAYPDFSIAGKFGGSNIEFDGTTSTNTLSSNSSSVDGFAAKYHLAYNPSLAATTVSGVTASSAILHSEITDTSGDTNTTRGFQYSIDNSYSNTVSEDGSFTAEGYSLELSGLACNTTYNLRSFSESSAGIGTGTATTLTTSACPSGGSRSSSSSGGGSDKPSPIVPPIVNAIPTVVVTNVPALTMPAVKFNRNLSSGMSGEDVKALQAYLNQNNFKVAESGVGSPGQETIYFGPLTRAAVIKFQDTYKDIILAPLGLSSGTGYVGVKTREFINNGQ